MYACTHVYCLHMLYPYLVVETDKFPHFLQSNTNDSTLSTGTIPNTQHTVEPLNKRHNGTDHFGEVVLFQRQKCIATVALYRLVHWKVSFIQRCPLYRGVLNPLSEVPL